MTNRKPVIALVGRPNVGKSTLFNKLTRSQDALVADQPGLTRDRQYGDGKVGDWPYLLIDTGGLSGAPDTLDAAMADQTLQAVREADAVVFVVDGRAGLSAIDEEIAQVLRRQAREVLLCVNKIDGIGEDKAQLDFHELGFAAVATTAAAHNRGIQQLVEQLGELLGIEAQQPTEKQKGKASRRQRRAEALREFEEGIDNSSAAKPEQANGALDESTDRPESDDASTQADSESTASDDATPMRDTRIAFVGRPNVGKSTLINRLLGEARVIAYDQPGTTRDAVAIPFERAGRDYVLVDTAGVRKRGKVKEKVEIFSAIKTLQAIDQSNVCVMLLDARDGVTEQDLSLLAHIIDKGRALVVAVNKWDDLDEEARLGIREELERRLEFLAFTRIHFISALRGSGVNDVFKSINRAYKSAFTDLSTPRLTRLLEVATAQHQPPMVNGRRIKLRFAHQGGQNPPVIVVHGKQVEKLPQSYARYLVNYFQKALHLFGTPLRVEFRQGDNPFKEKGASRKERKGGNSSNRERYEQKLARRQRGRGDSAEAEGQKSSRTRKSGDATRSPGKRIPGKQNKR